MFHSGGQMTFWGLSPQPVPSVASVLVPTATVLPHCSLHGIVLSTAMYIRLVSVPSAVRN